MIPYMGEAYGLLVGAGSLAISLGLAYIVYTFARYTKELMRNCERVEVVKGLIIDKISKKKGYDIEKELLRREATHKQRNTFISKMETQVYEDMFGKE